MNIGDKFHTTFKSRYQNPDGTSGVHEFELLVRITEVKDNGYAGWETVTVVAERGRPTQVDAQSAPSRGEVVVRLMERIGFRPAH